MNFLAWFGNQDSNWSSVNVVSGSSSRPLTCKRSTSNKLHPIARTLSRSSRSSRDARGWTRRRRCKDRTRRAHRKCRWTRKLVLFVTTRLQLLQAQFCPSRRRRSWGPLMHLQLACRSHSRIACSLRSWSDSAGTSRGSGSSDSSSPPRDASCWQSLWLLLSLVSRCVRGCWCPKTRKSWSHWISWFERFSPHWRCRQTSGSSMSRPRPMQSQSFAFCNSKRRRLVGCRRCVASFELWPTWWRLFEHLMLLGALIEWCMRWMLSSSLWWMI